MVEEEGVETCGGAGDVGHEVRDERNGTREAIELLAAHESEGSALGGERERGAARATRGTKKGGWGCGCGRGVGVVGGGGGGEGG